MATHLATDACGVLPARGRRLSQGVDPHWTIRAHSRESPAHGLLTSPINLTVSQRGSSTWRVVAFIELRRDLRSCEAIVMTATSKRAIYGGLVHQASHSAGGVQAFEAHVVIDVPANYSLFVDVDSINLPEVSAACRAGSAPLLSRSQNSLPLSAERSVDLQDLPTASVVPREQCAPSTGPSSGRWLRCDALPLTWQHPRCAAALPRGWAWAPWHCWWDLVPLAERVRNSSNPIWLMVAGNSAVRGRWNAALMDLVATDEPPDPARANALLRGSWRCWGSLDVIKGALRVTYRDMREWWSRSHEARFTVDTKRYNRSQLLDGYKSACTTWWATLRQHAANGTGPRLTTTALLDPRLADNAGGESALSAHVELSRGAPTCFSAASAYQADVKQTRCRDMRWAASTAEALGACFVDEWSPSWPVVHANENYAFKGESGFSFHPYFITRHQHGPYANESWFRGNVEAMALQVSLDLASRLPLAAKAPWARDHRENSCVRTHCAKLFHGAFALNWFLNPTDLTGIEGLSCGAQKVST